MSFNDGCLSSIIEQVGDRYKGRKVASDHFHHLSITAHNDGLQLRRAISIQAEGIELLEKHAIAPSAARLCSAPSLVSQAVDSKRALHIVGRLRK